MLTSILVQVLINGILSGTMYGIAAIGLSLIFGTMRIVFIAQGTIIILAAYGSYWLFSFTGIDPYVSIIFIVPASSSSGSACIRAFSEKWLRQGNSPLC